MAVVSLADYHRIGGALRERGFVQTLEEGEPPYRWTYAGLKLDLMPTEAGILGFSNRWYDALLRSAVMMVIGGSPAVRTPVVRERLRAIAALGAGTAARSGRAPG